MSGRLKRDYLDFQAKCYRRADKKKRSQILDEVESNTGLHRKSLIRAFGKKADAKETQQRGARRIYDEETIKWLRSVWKKTDQMCSKKLVEAMPDWTSSGPVNSRVAEKLCRMSASSIDRYLKPYRAIYRRSRRSGTRPGKLLKDMIPVKSLGNVPDRAGFVEADTVAHCGGTLLGEFIWSLNITDEFSGWTESRGVWGKHAKNVHAAIEDIENGLPFEVLGFNVDNGSEFLNHRIKEYLSENKEGGPKHRKRFVMTRSRSYHKNDNAHVEQKNWTHIRQLFGYERFEFKELLSVMNEIYRVSSLLTNFFHPQMKLKSKEKVGKRYKKKYDKPKTPYQRLLEDPHVTDSSKSRLRALRKELNPWDLADQREALLTQFFSLKRKLQSERNRVSESQNPSLGNPIQ